MVYPMYIASAIMGLWSCTFIWTSLIIYRIEAATGIILYTLALSVLELFLYSFLRSFLSSLVVDSNSSAGSALADVIQLASGSPQYRKLLTISLFVTVAQLNLLY